MNATRVTVLILGFAGAFLPSYTLGNEVERVSGVVERRTGRSHVERGDGSERVIVDTGVRVFDKDLISTEKGRVHIRFRDGTLAEVGEHSKFEVDRVFQRKRVAFEKLMPLSRVDESVYRLHDGGLRMTAIELDIFQQYTVKTEFAVIHVTEPSDFLMAKVNDGKQCEIRLLSGKLNLVNIITNEVQELKAGYSAVMKSNGLIQSERRLSGEEVRFLKNRTGI